MQNILSIAVSDLKEYEKNSRTHSPGQVQQLCDSINEFGFTVPLLVDENNVVLAGHGRLMAAKNLGMTEVPCVQVSHLSSEQKRAYVITDNKLALNSGWNQDILRSELEGLAENPDLEFNLEITGFDFRELDALDLFRGVSEATTLVPLGGGEPGKNKAKSVHSVVSFGAYRISASPAEMEKLEAVLKVYEDKYGLHQGFIGWLSGGRL